jgi:hypothetical protein
MYDSQQAIFFLQSINYNSYTKFHDNTTDGSVTDILVLRHYDVVSLEGTFSVL